VLFLDISGEFDCTWPAAVLAALRRSALGSTDIDTAG
jgi:hypothetical protein